MKELQKLKHFNCQFQLWLLIWSYYVLGWVTCALNFTKKNKIYISNFKKNDFNKFYGEIDCMRS